MWGPLLCNTDNIWDHTKYHQYHYIPGHSHTTSTVCKHTVSLQKAQKYSKWSCNATSTQKTSWKHEESALGPK